ncbi:MAG: hypothetical protein Q9195_006423 [Heterodermia aff. obscurata]
MALVVRREIDVIFECLELALNMRKEMRKVASSHLHLLSTKRIILRKVEQLCWLMGNIHETRPKATEVEVMEYLIKMVRVKVELHAVVDVFWDVNWAAVDEAMSAAYAPLEA